MKNSELDETFWSRRMNERIKELVAQCRETHLSNTGELYTEFDEEKFAELIVRGCAHIAFSQASHYAETQNKGSAASAADCIGRLIKIKFGVE